MVAGNYNKSLYDRTKWYAFGDESLFLTVLHNGNMHVSELTDGRVRSDRPIPIDNAVDNKKEIYKEKNPLRSTAKSATKTEPDATQEHFDLFWSTYPKRAGSNPKATALKSYTKLLKDNHEADVILAGVKRYAKFCEATDKIRTEYVMLAATFLNQMCFLDDFLLPDAPASKTLEYDEMPLYKKMLEEMAEHGSSDITVAQINHAYAKYQRQ